MADVYNPEQSRVVLFPGDKYRPSVTIAEVTAFSSVSGVLIGPDDVDRTAAYAAGSASAALNTASGHLIGIGTGTIVAGEYRYYLTGAYEGSIIRTWYWPITVTDKLGGV